MASTAINVNLDSTNTTVNSNPVQYNLNVVVDLSSIWSYIISSQNNFNRLFVQTSLSIPVLKNDTEMYVDLSLINYYNLNDIINKQIIQYGYYEGNYDDTRAIDSNNSVWCYTMVT